MKTNSTTNNKTIPCDMAGISSTINFASGWSIPPCSMILYRAAFKRFPLTYLFRAHLRTICISPCLLKMEYFLPQQIIIISVDKVRKLIISGVRRTCNFFIFYKRTQIPIIINIMEYWYIRIERCAQLLSCSYKFILFN